MQTVAPALLVLSVLFAMISRSLANAKTIGICGCGVAGSVAANALARSGYEVHIFEGGRGPGGRSSARLDRRLDQYSFDHGECPLMYVDVLPFGSLSHCTRFSSV
jgi:heterodisulfide reductase subunit A-like polyferredoxin